jgi:hypothetical protein
MPAVFTGKSQMSMTNRECLGMPGNDRGTSEEICYRTCMCVLVVCTATNCGSTGQCIDLYPSMQVFLWPVDPQFVAVGIEYRDLFSVREIQLETQRAFLAILSLYSDCASSHATNTQKFKMKLAIYTVAALALLAGPVLGERLGEVSHRELAKPSSGTGGSYFINFAAADPTDYIPYVPFPAECTPIVGRGDGSVVIPMADFSDGDKNVKVESLMPEDMVMGQIVPFVIKISVTGDVESGNIQFKAFWNTMTQSNKDFGYEYTKYGVYAAFVDTSDGAHNDPGGDATVSSFSWDKDGDEIVGIFNLSGLDDGDEVVVEVWVVLREFAASDANSNVHSGIVVKGAQTAEGDEINVGQQTIPVMLGGGNEFSTNINMATAFRTGAPSDEDALCEDE